MKIISLSAENFKCFPSITINFSDVTTISGQNASGKTSIFDMFTYLLWDKDSEGSGKFNPQPIDANGERIHSIETSVTGVFDIGGENIELKKIIAEKWTKKRGEAEPVFTGYQSKFWVNGFEKKPKEYQEYIASIIDPGIFPLVSDPLAFSKLPWEKQRNILLQFVGNISDEEATQAIENYELIKSDIHMASVSECKKKYSDIFKQHDKKCSEYLTTVQDLERRNREIDINALTEQKDALQTDINNAESLLKSVSIPGIGDLNQKIAACQSKQRMLAEQANAERTRKLADANLLEIKTVKAINEFEAKRDAANDEIQRIADRKAELERQYNKLAEDFKATKEMTLDESETVCRMCGQKLPEGQIQNIKANFTATVEARKKSINTEASKVKKEIKALDAKKIEIQDEKILKDLQKDLVKVRKSITALSKEIDVSGTKEYKALDAEIAKVRQEIAELDVKQAEQSQMEEEIAEKRRRLNYISNQLAVYNSNKETIEQYRAEWRTEAGKSAEAQGLLNVLSEYAQFISKKINDAFPELTFKLFEKLINGEEKETCEISLSGIPYSDLNNGHKIVIGLNIIRNLQKMYNFTCPIWIDNAESVNSYNLPKMPCQMVLLKVTDDLHLTIS